VGVGVGEDLNMGVPVWMSMAAFSLCLHPHPDSFEIFIKILSIKLLVYHIILLYNLIIIIVRL
jgi:hypothetical protein